MFLLKSFDGFPFCCSRQLSYEHVYTEESLMGHVGRIASRSHALTMERTTMHRYRALLELCSGMPDHETRGRAP